MKATFIATFFIGSALAAVVAPNSDGICSPNAKSTAPEPVNNTLAGFNEHAGYTILAWQAKAPTGYEATLTNANCAIDSPTYMLYSKLESYDVQACANICERHHGCDAFNIYVQREPGVSPGPQCPNPKAIFTAICALYSEPVSPSKCTNAGQYIGPEDATGEAFKTTIRASNVYARIPAKEAVKVVTTTRNIFYDKQSLHIQTIFPSETAFSKHTDTIVSKVTSLESIPTAVPGPGVPQSIVDEINSQISKMIYLTTGTEPVSPPWTQVILNPLPSGYSAPLLPQTSAVQQGTPVFTKAASQLSAVGVVTTMVPPSQQANTTISQTTVLQPAPTPTLPSQAPSIKQISAATTEVANTTPAPTPVSAPVLLGAPFSQQNSTTTSTVLNPSALAAPFFAVPPSAPSSNLVNFTTAILQSKLTTLFTAVIPQAPSVIQNTSPAAKQLVVPTDVPTAISTAVPTTPVPETSWPVTKRWYRARGRGRGRKCRTWRERKP